MGCRRENGLEDLEGLPGRRSISPLKKAPKTSDTGHPVAMFEDGSLRKNGRAH